MRDDTMQPPTSHRRTRVLFSLLVAAVLLTFASSAAALDNYADRKGPFVGLGVGGGIGAVDMSNPGEQAGFEDGRVPGFHLNGIVGGGINQNIVAGVQLNWWGRTVEQGSRSWAHHHSNALAMADLFLIEGLYVEGGLGLAYTTFEAERDGGQPYDYSEMGFATKVGLGFEYFINGTHAVGINAGYTRHFYSDASFDTFGGGIGIRWY